MADALIAKEFAGYRIEAASAAAAWASSTAPPTCRSTAPSRSRCSTPSSRRIPTSAAVRPESKLAASLDHPNVIPIYAAGESTACPTSRCASCRASDLRAVLRARAGCEPGRAARIVAQLGVRAGRRARGRPRAPGRQARQRARREGRPRVPDRLRPHQARAADAEATKTGVVLGTLDYMAPEQIRGQAIGPFTDVYSLGCMIMHLLTGEVPFPRRGRRGEAVGARRRAAAAPERAGRRGSADAFDPVVARAMGKRPEDRFATAGEVGAAMTAAAACLRRRHRRCARPRPRPRRPPPPPGAGPPRPRARLRARAVQPRACSPCCSSPRSRWAGPAWCVPLALVVYAAAVLRSYKDPETDAPARAREGERLWRTQHGRPPPSSRRGSRSSAAAMPFLHYRDARRLAADRRARGRPAARSRSGGARTTPCALGWDAEVSRVHAQLEPVGREWVARRRRAVAQRDVRQRRAGRRAAPAARRRPHLLRRDRRALPRAARARSRARRPPSPPAARQLPLTETQRRVLVALCRPLEDSAYATPATNREIAEEIYLSVDAVKAHLRVLFERLGIDGAAAEPEARAAGGGRAGRRARAPARLLITLRGGGQGRVHDDRGGGPRGPALEPGQGLLPAARLDEARPRRVLPRGRRRRARSTCASARP